LFELLDRRVVHVEALPFQERLQGSEAARELVVGPRQCGFGFDAELSRKIGEREQQIAHFLHALRAPLGQGATQLGDLFFDFLDDLLGLWPVEADGGRARANLVRAEKARQRARDSRQHAGLRTGRGLLARFDAFPLFEHNPRSFAPLVMGGRERTSGRREDVRMPADELRGDLLDDVGDGEASLAFCHLRVKDHLKQDVAQFSAEHVESAAVDDVKNLVRFLEEIRTEAPVGLLAIPGASVRRSKRRHDLDQPLERGGRTAWSLTGSRRFSGQLKSPIAWRAMLDAAVIVRPVQGAC